MTDFRLQTTDDRWQGTDVHRGTGPGEQGTGEHGNRTRGTGNREEGNRGTGSEEEGNKGTWELGNRETISNQDDRIPANGAPGNLEH